MHVASMADHYEVVRCLIQAGASVTKPDTRGDLPIHWAATVGHTDVSMPGVVLNALFSCGWSRRQCVGVGGAGEKEAICCAACIKAAALVCDGEPSFLLHMMRGMHTKNHVERNKR